MAETTRVRFAPSPTGRMHVGNFRSALYNYLFARRHGGVFYVRIEDTDRARLVEGGVESILRTLKAMGIEHDEGPFLKDDGTIEQRGEKAPYIQSERLDLYRRYAEDLIEAGNAYRCFCTAERLAEVRQAQEAAHQPTGYDRRCRDLDSAEVERRLNEPHVIRFRIPAEEHTDVRDIIRGLVTFKNALLDDYVLLKSDGFPTYHLASVVDDKLMGTTHVIRGEEWLSSAPKHVLLYQALGWKGFQPEFAHLPLLLNPDRSKLSKRQGDVAVEDYLEAGYLPEALINFVALMGWNPSEEQEIYTLEELIAKFDLKDVHPAGAVFNREKLDWLNGKYLRAMPLEKLAERAAPHFVRAGMLHEAEGGWSVAGSKEKLSAAELGRLLSLERERVKTLSELPEATSFLLSDGLEYPKERLAWKTQPLAEAGARLRAVLEHLGDLDDSLFTAKDLEESLKKLVVDEGWTNGEVLWPLRVALSGREKSPSPFEIMPVLGKLKVIRRLETALDRLK